MSATLADVARVLDHIAELVAAGREAFDLDQRQRWSIERLWIYAGNLADLHCREEAIDDGVEPWAELIRARNVYAHYTPAQIVSERIWHETVDSIKRVRQAIEAARA